VARVIAYVGVLWWWVSAALFCGSIVAGLVQPFVQRRRATRTDQPPVSAILPIKLLNPGFEAAQISLFDQDYPSYEVLISAAELNSPAINTARQIASAHPEVSSRFLWSPATEAVSPKLNNLVAPLAAARNDLILTKDSNITFERCTVAAFVQNFAQAVGLVVAVPVAVHAENLAGQIEGYLLNGHARIQLTASALGLGFGVGKAMLFRNTDLASAGGIAAISNSLAEDTALSRLLAGQGLKTVFSHETVAQEIGAPGFAEIYARQLRWSVIRRQNERFIFPFEPLASPLPAAIAAALAAPLASSSSAMAFALTLFIWFCIETGFAYCKGWEISVWSPLAFLGREILAIVSWLHAFVTHQVVWAQVRFDARQGPRGALETPRAAPDHAQHHADAEAYFTAEKEKSGRSDGVAPATEKEMRSAPSSLNEK
jgi:ceramide glucosyltransferase